MGIRIFSLSSSNDPDSWQPAAVMGKLACLVAVLRFLEAEIERPCAADRNDFVPWMMLAHDVAEAAAAIVTSIEPSLRWSTVQEMPK